MISQRQAEIENVYHMCWQLIQRPYLVLDTETTGLDDRAEVCQVAVVDGLTGKLVFNELVRPSQTIPPDASRVHGITDATVANSPRWPVLYPRFVELVAGQPLAIYNAAYDWRLINQSNRRYGLPELAATTTCIMNLAAVWWGDWSDWHGNYRWQRLGIVACELGIDTAGAHDAAADALMTWKVIQALAAQTRWHDAGS